MSLKTWIDEFYPTDIQQFKADLGYGIGDPLDYEDPKVVLAAARHSLRKWRGATPENLSKHGCGMVGKMVMSPDPERFHFSGTTCALCEVFYNNATCEAQCAACPIEHYSGTDCDGYANGRPTNKTSVYNKSLDGLDGDPTPMIELLEEIVEDLASEVGESP